jgi:hypothetical protein
MEDEYHEHSQNRATAMALASFHTRVIECNPAYNVDRVDGKADIQLARPDRSDRPP